VGEDEKGGKPTHLGFRADAALTARLDRLAEAMSKRVRGAEISRSAVLKSAVETALPDLELEYLGRVPGWSPEQISRWIEQTAERVLTHASRWSAPIYTKEFLEFLVRYLSWLDEERLRAFLTELIEMAKLKQGLKQPDD
jgi:predicted transcriptional regulator